MVFSKENHYIKSLNVNESDIIYFKNENSSDATNFKTSLSPNEIIEKLGAEVIEKQILENVKKGRYIVTEKYPEPHRNERGQIMIENCQLWNEDLKKYGSVQTMKWAEQGRYNLEGEALKKEQERIEKHFEELMNLRKK